MGRPDSEREVERRAFSLYEDLLTLPPADRDVRLNETCLTEPALLAAVQAMFSADRHAELLPTVPPSPRTIERDDQPPPERIGPFRIVSEIGRGGMGVVYRGERDDGLYEQTVAIKLIRRTLFSERALAQFAIERRILARLHHPHIAQMLEGGITADGASYIVMELVEGAPITRHADEAGLDLRARLALFKQVAAAIEHAHRTLVVHADIKPNNVVVCEGFGVKLLDFGIARLLGDADEVQHDAFTPGFGSPERQAGLPLTPADDIFALGVLMRELVEPMPGADADLRAIVAKASASDPSRRYGAASEVIADIERWRHHQPVDARPADARHRASLYWRRHRLGVGVAASTTMLVLIATIMTTWLWLRAEQARAQAEKRFEETRALSRYLIDDVTSAIAPLPGSGAIQEQIARHAESALERLSQVPGTSADVQADSVAASERVGSILAGLDRRTSPDPLAADRALARAERGARALVATNPTRDDLKLLLAKTLVDKAKGLGIQRNDAVGALRALDEGAALTAGILARDPHGAAAIDTRWDGLLLRAEILDRGNRLAAIPPLLLPTLRRLPAAPPTDAEQALDTEQGWTKLGDARWYGGDRAAALASFRRSLAALSAPALATDARIVLRRIYVEYELATTLVSLGRKDQALAEMARGVTAARRLRSFDDTPKARHMSNIAELEYAVELGGLHRFAEAIPAAQASVTGREALARLEPGNYDAERAVPVGLRPYAEILRDAGRPVEACATAHRADDLWSALAKGGPLAGFDGESERGEVAKLLRWCGARQR